MCFFIISTLVIIRRFYKTIFSPWMGREFQCRENDYTIESVDGSIKRKFGGNAQVCNIDTKVNEMNINI